MVLNWEINGGSVDKWIDSEHILNVQLNSFSTGLLITGWNQTDERKL